MPLPDETLALARRADAILFGAAGGPGEESLPREKRPGNGLLKLRKEMELFANFRPAYMFPELIGASTLKPEVVEGLDLVILRELNGDAYFGEPRGIETTPSGERVGFNTIRYSESEIERIAHVGVPRGARAPQEAVLGRQGQRAGSHAALARGRDRRRQELPRCRAFAPVRRRGGDEPHARAEAVRRDRHGQHVRRHPIGRGGDAHRLDRHAPFGFARVDRKGLYEPVHGSAPDIAGQDIANPLAAILSLAMMLRQSFDLQDKAQQVEAAVRSVLAQGYRTADIHQPGTRRVGTEEMGDAVVGILRAKLAA